MEKSHESDKLNSLLGKTVEAWILTNGNCRIKVYGILKKAELQGRYKIGNHAFRKSHVKSIWKASDI